MATDGVEYLRLTDVHVNVGDTVKRGQLLARIAADAVSADLAQARASVVEAEAALAEAKANADRSKQLQAQGFISPQATIQVVTAEQTTAARLLGMSRDTLRYRVEKFGIVAGACGAED